ncbi:MAG: terminase family protein [Candidatus Bathyarchaeia archaeon]
MKRLKSELDKLEQELQSLDQEQTKIEIPEDPNIFCHKILGFTPTLYQQQFIASFKENRWIALRWCRQSGKTHIVSAMLLWYALRNPNIHIAVVGPSWRQTKKIISVINAFLTRLPKHVYNKPQKTKVSLKNGSVIEAFPNNPETIRGFTFHVIYCDEMNFIPNDADLYDAILFTLGTTAGKFICSSTPGSNDSLFWKIFNDKAFEKYAKHHITWREAVEPSGPLKREMLEEIRLQYSADPWRWQREMEAVWVEDESSYFPLSLITQCIDGELDYYDFHDTPEGEFYIGVDFGKKQDYSAVAVVQREGDMLKLVHITDWQTFPLGTPYVSVIGYIKSLWDRWHTILGVYADQTGVGEYIVEDMIKSGIANTTGITLTIPTKQDILGFLRQQMQAGKLKIPYDRDLIAEINVEKYEVLKSGQIQFSHPEGTHDDRLWALALAVYATKAVPPSGKGVVLIPHQSD